VIRPIRAELRGSSARTIAILLFVVAALFTAGMVRTWWRQWLMFGYVEASLMFVVVPLALACGAMLGRREKRTRAAELMASTGRPLWQRITPAMSALGAAVATAHLLLVGVCAALIGSTGGWLGAAGFPSVLVDTALLVGAVWTGLALGRWWSSALLPPALAAAVLVVQFVAAGAEQFDAAGADQPTPLVNLSLMVQFQQFPWEGPTAVAVLGRLALAAGLVVGGALLASAASWWGRGAATAALAAGVAGLLLIPPPTDTRRYQIEPSAQALTCADGTPQVCVTAVYAYALPGVVPQARRALAALAKLPNAPTRAAEFQPSVVGDGSSDQFQGNAPRTDPTTVRFSLQPDWLTGADPHVAEDIAFGAGTRWNGCAQDDEAARAAAGAWLLGTDELHVFDGTFDDWATIRDQTTAILRTLRKQPEQEQLRRVTALRDAANRCEKDLTPILTGKPKEAS